MPPPKPPTLQAIADETGYGRSTISLALRNHPSLPESTRMRIRNAAERLGYRPNPMVAALMTQLRDQRRTRQVRIALISRMKLAIPKRKNEGAFYQMLYAAVLEHAEARGFGVDEFYLGKDPLSDARISDILKTRGIHGVLFFPGADNILLEYPILDWRYFATVVIGFGTVRENLHHVASDYAYDIGHALQRCTAAGLQRVGLAVTSALDEATKHSWVPRFLLYQYHARQKNRVPWFQPLPEESDKERLLEWFHRHRPEAILIAGNQVSDRLIAGGVRVPDDVRIINLVQRGEPGLAGIDPHTPEVGRAAVEMLAALLQANQLGLPDFPRTIAIKGHWSPGKSFPD